MKIESKELHDFIRSTVTAVKEGVAGTGFSIQKPVKFNLAIITTKEKGGGLKIYVADAKGKLKSEEISHIEFEAEPDAAPRPRRIRKKRR